ncbi:MAG TPA: hypothetical protein VI643_05360 [Planctomycetota bacterium]|nr:hypothetical protein [Planctomycetota bacterium]
MRNLAWTGCLLAAAGCAQPPEGIDESKVWTDAGTRLLEVNNPPAAYQNFQRALAAWKDNVTAQLGLAEASREYGNMRFQEALKRLDAVKGTTDRQDIAFAQSLAKPEYEAGIKLHDEAGMVFDLLIKKRPTREAYLQSVFGLARLHYERINSPWSPYVLGAWNDPSSRPELEKAVLKDRDEAIRLLRLFLSEAGGKGVVFAPRLLATLLIARAGAGELEEAEQLLADYERLQLTARERVMKIQNPDVRTKTLEFISRELQAIDESREVIRLRREERTKPPKKG